MSDKIVVENVNVPGQVTNVDVAKYNAMMTAREIKEAAKPLLPEDLFPSGATSGWWAKCVQLDLEAKAVLTRHATKPLSWSKT